MSNEIIGIAGSFGVTIFLFLLRFIYLSIGNKSRSITHTRLTGNKELIGKAADDSWLLWKPDPNPRTGPPKRASHP